MNNDEKILSGILFSLFFLLAFCMVLDYSLEYEKLKYESMQNKTIILYDDRIVILPENQKYNDSINMVMF